MLSLERSTKMLFVPCPRCGAAVEIADDLVGVDLGGRWPTARCGECALHFLYDAEEVQIVGQQEQAQQR
jgi:ribosomal protein S27AE